MSAASEQAALARRLRSSRIEAGMSQAEVADVIERLIELYLLRRDSEEERFIDVVRRIGIEPFKEHVYGSPHQVASGRRRQLAVA